MIRLIDANRLWLEMASETAGYCYPCDMMWKAIENTETVDAIPIEWIMQYANGPLTNSSYPYKEMIEEWKKEQRTDEE